MRRLGPATSSVDKHVSPVLGLWQLRNYHLRRLCSVLMFYMKNHLKKTPFILKLLVLMLNMTCSILKQYILLQVKNSLYASSLSSSFTYCLTAQL